MILYSPPMPEPRDLPSLREAIEAIDREILTHLRRRMDLAEEVAAAKLRTALPLPRGAAGGPDHPASPPRRRGARARRARDRAALPGDPRHVGRPSEGPR